MKIRLLLLLLICASGYGRAQEVKRFRVSNVSILNNLGGIERDKQRWESEISFAKPKNPTLIIYKKNLKLSVFSGQIERHYSVVQILDKEVSKEDNEVRHTLVCVDSNGVKCTVVLGYYITTGAIIGIDVAYGNVRYSYLVSEED